MERMVNKRLEWVLERKNVIQNFQCGSIIDDLIQMEAETKYAFV